MSDRKAGAGHEPRSTPFRVGEWLAEPDWNRIRRDGETVKLEPRVMRLLATLAAAPGRPLLRQELLDTVWPDTFVNEEALSRAVSQLRRALGDDPKSPRYLQTVHKGGYCLIASVTEARDEAAPAPAAAAAPAPSRRRLWAIPLLVLAVIAAAILYLGVRPDPQSPLRSLVPLTSDPGREIDPAVSPDGRRVAYLASTETGYDLFVRGMDGGAPVRLTRNALAKGHPAWSPSGDRLAFVAADGDSAAIYVQPVAGGEAAKLVDLPSWSFGLDWSPDGRTLAYVDAAPGEAPAIVLLDIATKAARPIARAAGSAGDIRPVFSPDGRRVAFIRSDEAERQWLAVADLRSGATIELLGSRPQQIRGMDWAPDGGSLIFSARWGRRFGLWRIAADADAEPVALAAEGGELFNPSVSREGRIVVEEVEQDRDVWQTDLAGGASAALVRSTSDDFDPAYDLGGALAFISERSGSAEIWVQRPGHEAVRLTHLAGPDLRHIAWSPDGARLGFAAGENGLSSLHAVEARGGEAVRLLRRRSALVPIGWAQDGDALFFLSSASVGWRLEEIGRSGREARSLGMPLLRLAAIAPDGRSIFAIPAGEDRLLQIVRGRGVVRQYRLPDLPRLAALLPSPASLYLVDEGLGTATIHRLDLRSGAIGVVARLDHYGGGSVSLDPGGRSVAYTRARETANDLAWTQL